MLSVKKSPKQLAGRALKDLALSFKLQKHPRWQKQHKAEVIYKLLQISNDYGLGLELPMAGDTPGEGVGDAKATNNKDQFQPPANFLQCAPSEAVTGKCLDQLPIKLPVHTTTSYSDGSVTSIAHEMKGREGSVSVGGGVDTVRVEIEAPGAKEGGSFTVPPDDPWPGEGKVKILSFCPNPKLCRGGLIDDKGRVGKVVSVWQGRYRLVPGNVYDCKLDLVQGADARYLPVNTP